MINKLRETYFIDFLSQKIVNLHTKYFRTTALIYSDEWDKRHYATINTENPSGFNLLKFLERIKKKEKKKRSTVFNLREFVVRIFITIIFNSKQLYNDNMLKKLYDVFYPEISNENDEESEEKEESEDAEVEHCVVMNDAVIGKGAELKYVILDKNVTVTPGAKLIGTRKNPIIVKRGETV